MALFASSKFELDLKRLSSDSPFAQPRRAASCQRCFPQKKHLLQKHAAHYDNVSTGDTPRSCKGQKDSDGPEFGAAVLNGWLTALLTEAASFCQAPCGLFAAKQHHPTLLHLSKEGGKKANVWISRLLVHHTLVLCPVLSVATYHGTAGTRALAEGGRGAFSSVGVRISLYFSTWRLWLPNPIMKNWKSNNPY